MQVNNLFFNLALARASRLVGRPARLVNVLAQLFVKFHRTNWQAIQAGVMREKFFALGRLLQAHVRGHYKVRSMKLLVTLLAAVLYFINPLDLIPDMLFGIGLADDFAVLTWVYQAAASELDAFLKWEISTATNGQG